MQRTIQPTTLCIAVGLALMIAVQLWPALPVVSAVAMIGLGATSYVAERWRHQPLAVAMHLMLYTGLALLFAGARLHAATMGISDWRIVDSLDFYIAAGLVALSFSTTLHTLKQAPFE